jgi:hypothetical protein
MSTNDFISKCQSYKRYQSRLQIFYVVAMAAVVITANSIKDGCASLGCLLVVLAIAGLCGFVMFYAVVRGPKNRTRSLGLLCAVCNGRLVNSNGAPSTIEGYCPHCHTRVPEA